MLRVLPAFDLLLHLLCTLVPVCALNYKIDDHVEDKSADRKADQDTIHSQVTSSVAKPKTERNPNTIESQERENCDFFLQVKAANECTL